MKKFIIIFSSFLCLSFNIIQSTPVFAASDTFKEGIYTLADLKITPNNAYTIQNVSQSNNVRIFIFNENYIIMQTQPLGPHSKKVVTIPIMPGYIFLIVGYGEISIAPKSP